MWHLTSAHPEQTTTRMDYLTKFIQIWWTKFEMYWKRKIFGPLFFIKGPLRSPKKQKNQFWEKWVTDTWIDGHDWYHFIEPFLEVRVQHEFSLIATVLIWGRPHMRTEVYSHCPRLRTSKNTWKKIGLSFPTSLIGSKCEEGNVLAFWLFYHQFPGVLENSRKTWNSTFLGALPQNPCSVMAHSIIFN